MGSEYSDLKKHYSSDSTDFVCELSDEIWPLRLAHEAIKVNKFCEARERVVTLSIGKPYHTELFSAYLHGYSFVPETKGHWCTSKQIKIIGREDRKRDNGEAQCESLNWGPINCVIVRVHIDTKENTLHERSFLHCVNNPDKDRLPQKLLLRKVYYSAPVTKRNHTVVVTWLFEGVKSDWYSLLKSYREATDMVINKGLVMIVVMYCGGAELKYVQNKTVDEMMEKMHEYLCKQDLEDEMISSSEFKSTVRICALTCNGQFRSTQCSSIKDMIIRNAGLNVKTHPGYGLSVKDNSEIKGHVTAAVERIQKDILKGDGKKASMGLNSLKQLLDIDHDTFMYLQFVIQDSMHCFYKNLYHSISEASRTGNYNTLEEKCNCLKTSRIYFNEYYHPFSEDIMKCLINTANRGSNNTNNRDSKNARTKIWTSTIVNMFTSASRRSSIITALSRLIKELSEIDEKMAKDEKKAALEIVREDKARADLVRAYHASNPIKPQCTML